MSAQVVFYAIDRDQVQLIQLLDDLGLRALPELIATDDEVLASSPSAFLAHVGSSAMYLLPQDLADVEALYKELPNDPLISKLSTWDSPVIEFLPSVRQGSAVRDGRLFVGTNASDPLYSSVKRPFDQAARHIRKWAKTDQFGFYVGPATAELAHTGEIELRHHQVTLKVGVK